MEVFIKNLNTLRFYEPCIIPEYNCNFQVPSNIRSVVLVSLDFHNKKIEASCQYNISNELFEYLQKCTDTNDKSNINPFENEELSRIISDLEQSSNKVISLIKYCLNRNEINDNQPLRARILFSYDGNEWIIPNTAASWADCGGSTTLDYFSAQKIQEYLNNDFIPSLALKFLSRAGSEENLQIKWIEAAAAIEIAMKEFLIKKDPKRYRRIKPKPQQSIVEFCGEQIKEYTSENIPRLENLIEGAKIRNSIIHGPDEPKITHKEANNYIHDVDEAIHFMLYRLYPNDRLIQLSYDHSKMRPFFTKEEVMAEIKRDMSIEK